MKVTEDEEVMGRFGVKERNQEGLVKVGFAKRMETYFQKTGETG